jgi:hypothetical protein
VLSIGRRGRSGNVCRYCRVEVELWNCYLNGFKLRLFEQFLLDDSAASNDRFNESGLQKVTYLFFNILREGI